MSSKHGWIALSREVTSHWIWSCEPYSKAQAWVDLLLHANHADTKIIIKGTLVHLRRGQQARSQVTLAEQWKWSRDKVKRFLKMLEKDGMIIQQTSQLTSIITICNYKEFQDIKEKTSQQTSHQTSHQTSQQADSRQVTVNNDNKVNNENKYIFPCKDGEFTATDDYISALQDSYKKIDVLQELGKAYQWILANPKKQKTVAGMPRFITNWLNRKKQGSSKIPHEEIAQCYNEHFAKPLGLNDCEEMTDARIQAASKIWFRKTEGEKRTDSIKYFKNYFAYCATRDTLSGVINGYAPTIDRLLKYETYIKTIEDAYRCQN